MFRLAFTLLQTSPSIYVAPPDRSLWRTSSLHPPAAFALRPAIWKECGTNWINYHPAETFTLRSSHTLHINSEAWTLSSAVEACQAAERHIAVPFFFAVASIETPAYRTSRGLTTSYGGGPDPLPLPLWDRKRSGSITKTAGRFVTRGWWWLMHRSRFRWRVCVSVCVFTSHRSCSVQKLPNEWNVNCRKFEICFQWVKYEVRSATCTRGIAPCWISFKLFLK